MVSSMSRKFCAAIILMIISFSISVAQNTISCVGNFNLSLGTCDNLVDGDCPLQVKITPEMIAAGNLSSLIEYSVSLKDEHGNLILLEDENGNLTPSDILNCNHKSTSITYTLTDESSKNSCWGVMYVEDKIAPTIPGCESGDYEIAVGGCFSYTRLDISMSDIAQDNCDPHPELIILDEYLSQDICDETILKTIIRTVKAVDDCGNESEPCRVTVPLQRVPFELISETDNTSVFVFPQDTVIDCGLLNSELFPENLDFNNNPDPIELSGTPYFQVNSAIQYNLFPIDEMSHCKLDVIYQDSVLVRDACFTKIIRYWTVIEGCALDPIDTTIIQQITIMDLEAPEMTNVPEKLNFSTNSASEDVCAAITPIPIPTLTDNCQADEDLRLFVALCPDCYTTGGSLPQVEYTGQALSLPEGLSHLIYIGTDACFNGALGGINEVRDTVEVWVEDNAPPVCEIDGKAITLNNDTGEVKVKAEVFDDGSFDDCSNKVKIFAKRDDDGTICPCAPEDALDRYSGFIYLGRNGGHDYYLSEDTVIGPKAFNIAVAMGGYVADFEKISERNWVNDQVVEFLANSNTIADDVITYTVAGPDGAGLSGLAWSGNRDIPFFMGTTAVRRTMPYDGLSVTKRFVIEVEDICGYSEVIRFCCSDVIGGAPVTFRTMDKWGNFNECNLTVNIQDKVAPLIQCPPDDVALCNEDLSDLSIFGMPTSLDVCPAVLEELEPEIDISACNVGTIKRTFQISSGSDTLTCVQVISVLDTFPREDIDITFPPDIYLPQDADSIGLGGEDFTCFEQTDLLRPSNLTGIYERPMFDDNRVCSDLWYGYKDDVFEVPGSGPNTCFKIVRHWIVVDDCDPEQVDTIREYDQSIIITNNIPPEITFINPADTVCNIFDTAPSCLSEDIWFTVVINDECTASEDLDFTVNLNPFNSGDLVELIIPSDSISILNDGELQLIIDLSSLPIGDHSVVVEVTDACNNVNAAVHNFSVINCVAPIAACQALTMPLHCFPDPPNSPLNNGGTDPSQADCDGDGVDDEYIYMCSQAEWFAPIKGESYHPCGLPVVYSFSTDTTDVERCFTCSDLECPQEITIFITDEFGNVDSCVTTMTLTDPKGLCDTEPECFNIPTETTFVIDTLCMSMLPDGDLTEFGIPSPTFTGDCCGGNIQDSEITFDDEETENADGCLVFNRTWTLLKDCGCPQIQTYVQTIIINNSEAPTLDCPDNQTVSANVNCVGRINLEALGVDANCQTGISISNNFNANTSGDLGLINYPIGRTRITFTVENECGLSSTCVTRIIVNDDTAPICRTPNAVGPITVGLSGVSFTNQEILDQIFAVAGNNVSDNCDSLTFAANPPNFVCTDLGVNGMATIPVVFTVTDGSNNSTPCTASINLVEDGMPSIECPDDRTQVLNDQCNFRIPNYRNLVTINNTCTSGIAVADITQDPPVGTIHNGSGVETITMTATTEGGEMITCTFTITFVDETPPTVTCPAAIQDALLDANCVARIPDLRVASDTCDGTLPPRNNGNLAGVYQVPRQGTVWDGMSNLLVIAVDAAGNRDTCEVRLRAVDDTDPVCNTPNAVGPIPVGLDGVMFSDSAVLDIVFGVNGNNVSDNCMDINFSATPGAFMCTDLNADGQGQSMVTYTVTDGSGNTTTCTATINLVEAGQPAISCPMDRPDLALNVNCERRVPNYRPLVQILNTCTSNITLANVVQDPAPNTLITEVSTQTITMTATASNGQVFTCSFEIGFFDATAPMIDCPNGNVSASLDAQCRPRIPDLRIATDNCDGELTPLLANGPNRVYQQPRPGTIWNMTSDVLIIAVDASGNRDTCMVSLSADCPGPENAPEFNQVLPDLSTDSSNECEATISVPFMVSYCLPNNLVFTVAATGPNQNDVDLVVTSTGVTGTMPTGTHVVTITATDPDCNLSVSQSFNVTVIATGGTPATFECKKIVKAIEDGNVPSVTFDANEIVCVEGGVACDGSNPTIFGSFSNDPLDQTRTYVCGDLGDIQVTMFIFDVTSDGAGGLDTTFREPCFAIQTVVDPSGFCQFFTSNESNVEGRIQTENGGGIENTSVALIGSNDTQEYMTEEYGLYAFPSMPMGGEYTLRPHKEDVYTNGLSTLDIILMQKHILGIVPFDSPYKIIASDVNSSGSISAVDLLEMRKVILAVKDGFDNTPAWKMVDANYQFFDIENPLGDVLPDSYEIKSLDKNMAIDFIGIKMGDVNLSADPSSLVKAETRTSPKTLDFEIHPVINGNQVKFDFSSTNFIDIEGFQFTLDFDASELTYTEVMSSVLDMNSEHIGLTKSTDGFITISYDKIGGVTTSQDELLFSLVFTHKGELDHDLLTNSKVLAAQAYSTTDVFDLRSTMSYGNSDIKLYQNTPNPWQEETEISFNLPVDMDYEMRFYTVAGELLHSEKGIGSGGLNVIEMRRDQLSTKGLIYYELITAHEKTTKRMILIR